MTDAPFAAEAARCRAAQRLAAARPLRERLRWAAALRARLVEQARPLAEAVEADAGRRPGEVIATDLLPTAEAAKYLVRHAGHVLRPVRPRGRPLWLFGVRDTVYRRPHGVVAVIGTWNYPVFLNAVPILHALAAGNGVLWKPSEYAGRSGELLHRLFLESGVPADLFQRLPATREAGPALAEAAIDFLHFTGSDGVGRKLAARLGERLIPSVLELSGVDAVVARPDADLRLTARSAWYGATLNGGQTCMSSRRLFVPRDRHDELAAELRPLVAATPGARLVTAGQARQADELVGEAVAAGCEVVRASPDSGYAAAAIFGGTPELRFCREAAFAPLLAVIPYDREDDLPRLHALSPFGLAGSVFTADTAKGEALAAELAVGSVVVNDVIVPTAHPGTPFGGRGRSGWGATQGDDGLLAMTAPQVVSVRGGTFRPHVDAALGGDPTGDAVAEGALRMGHAGGVVARLRGLGAVIGAMRRMGR